jgi:Domain of unknown function (DUF1924)
MSRRIATLLAATALLLIAGEVFAGGSRDAILAELLAEAKKENPTFAGFSAARGGAFYHAKHTGGHPETPSCTTCHTADPRNPGETRTGKAIKPVAVSRRPTRFTDPEKVTKWFRRNCRSVLGRDCTAAEKGDYITYLMSQ